MINTPAPYPNSYYAATLNPAYRTLSFPALDGTVRADVAVIGGGFTGLSAALHLAEAGYQVVVLEAERLGWGASGRNGGQLHTDKRRDQEWLEARYPQEARALWSAGLAARDLVLDLIRRHQIAADYIPGHIYAAHRSDLVMGEQAYAEHLSKRYGYDKVMPLDRQQMAAALGTDTYFGGYRDGGGGHLQPLNLALGLAKAAQAAGAMLCEASRVVSITQQAGRRLVQTANGAVDAGIVLYAGNGYQRGLMPAAEARVLPIANYIATTRSFSENEQIPIAGLESASDTRFVIYYWRVTSDRRLLFGGGETYGQREPSDVASFVRRHLSTSYPALKDIEIDYAWGGTLGITASRMPFIRRLSNDQYAAMGYSGHGVANATFAGKVIADAIRGDTQTLDLFHKLKIMPFPGGTRLRLPLMVLAMTWAALRDRIGI